MKKLFMLLIAICAISLGMSAQQVVRGQVTDPNGEPLIGATVQPVGGGNGAATDVNGTFSLSVPYNVKTLKVSYVGYKTQELPIQPNMAITMSDNGTALDEVMVVAYGTAKKTSYTGSAEAVTNKKLELRPVTDATKALEGNVAGLQVTSSSGQPGSSPSIHIRGYGSVNAYSTPLYVVDGAPYDGNLSSINPSDIESMTVLKDASAAALYGARGANGVVMITTKKGVEGRSNVTWRSTLGWSSRATKRYQHVDQKEYVQLVYEALRNEAIDNGYSWTEAEAVARQSLSDQLGGEQYNPFKNYSWENLIDPATGYVREDAQSAWDEDWYDSVIRDNAFRHEHLLQVSGGSEHSQYMMSLGYLNEDGILKTTNYERYTGRANINSQITDWLAGNINTSLAHSVSNFSDYDGTSTSNVWYTAQFINPLLPVYLKDINGNNVYDSDGNIQYDWGEATPNGTRPGSLSDFSSLGMLLLDKAYTKRDAAGLRTGLVLGSDLAKYGWRQGIKLAANFSMDYNNRNYMRYMNAQHGNQANAGGLMEKTNQRTQSYTFNQLLTWDRTFGEHTFGLLFGHEWYAYQYSYLLAGKTNLVEGIYELRPGTTLYEADSYSDNYRIDSWLGRANYNYGGRYFLSASLRQDKSSRFHPDHNKGTFWSVGANWRVSGEKFMQNVGWVNNLSVKASYGEQGNDMLTTFYAWQSLYDLSYSNASNIGAMIASLENQNVSWEKSQNFNAGFDAILFNHRLQLNVEFYNRLTKNMLLNRPMALSTGFTGYMDNIGDMRNRGIEGSIRITPVRTADFEWNITAMATKNKNKVIKLTKEAPEIISGVRVIKEGLPIYTYYMCKSAGVDPSTGHSLYWAFEKDEDGNMIPGTEYITDDKSAAANCKYYLGSREPDLYGSLGTDFTWKGLTLSVLTTYSLGGKVYDSVYYSGMNLWYLSSTWNKNALRRWQKPGDVTDVPRSTIAESINTNDRFLIDASYFAIKNITLTYALPNSWVNKLGMTGARIFGSVDNLALWTHLDGMDPQYNFTGGTDYDYSPNKTYTVGIELNFGKTFAAAAPAVNVNALNSQINDLRAQLADAQGVAADANGRLAQLQGDLDAANRALANCKNDLNAAKNKPATVVDNSKQYMNILVHFPKSQTNVTADQRANVERVAAYLKSHPEATCVIKGYASPEGKEDVNVALANGRAASVKDMLVKKYGIAANRIQAAGQGISNMFDELSWNRVSICEIIVK
jgi:TonB-linked SusC/RagA family outer membrane protein